MNAVDLFSNIGGHALGFRDAEIQTCAFVEIDKGRQELLQYHFPNISVFNDVRNYVGPKGIGILIGGPPCKKTSVAAAATGNRTGESLWPSMLRVGTNMEPEWFVVEQPPYATAWETKVAFDLAEIGYHTAKVEFSASDPGAPHIRRRVFILAHRCLARLALAWQAVPTSICRVKRTLIARHTWDKGPPRTLRVDAGISNWLDKNAAIAAIGDANPPAMAEVIGLSIRAAYV